MFSRALRNLPVSTLSSHWSMLMLTFVLIDGCEYFGFSLCRVIFCLIFANQFKTSLSKINCISIIFYFQEKKNEGTLESLTEYSIIYTRFSYFLLFLFFFFYRG